MLAAALAPAPPAGAQELHGLFTTTYSATTSKSSDGAHLDVSGFTEYLDANWNAQISPLLGYRLTLRAQRLDATTDFGPGPRQNSTTLIQPGLDVTLASPFYSVNTGFKLGELLTDETTQGSARLSERYAFLRLTYTPVDLPTINLNLERLSNFDNRTPQSRDETDTRFNLGAQYTFRGLTLGYNFNWEVRDDAIRDRTETQQNQAATLTYQRNFFGDTLQVQANLFLSYTKNTEEFSAPGIALISRPLSTGLRAPSDPSPLNSEDAPVVTDQALVSGTANVPLSLFTAIGFGFQAADVVTTIEISVATDPSFLFPDNLADFLSFRVFRTDDTTLRTWTEVGTAALTFDKQQNRLTVVVPSSRARFFKIWVSRNDFGPLIRATKIAAPVPTPVIAGAEVSRTTKGGTLSGGITWAPVKWFSAAYNVNLNLNGQDPGGIQTTSGTHNLTLTLYPYERVTVTATGQYSPNSSNQAGVEDDSTTYYSLVVSYNPLNTLSTALTLSRSERRVGSDLDSRVDAVSLTAAAKLYRGLDVDASYTIGQSDTFVNDIHLHTFGQDATLRLNALLAPWLTLTTNYAFGYRDISPLPVIGDFVRVTNTLGVGLTLTLSRLVNLNGRWDYVTNRAGSSLVQQYRVDWNPTAKTSFFVNYTNTQARFIGVDTRSHSVQLNGRWRVTRSIDLNANCLFASSTAGGRVQEFTSFSLTGSLRF
jgi:hypothetical protein